jgi:hypothetical protein
MRQRTKKIRCDILSPQDSLGRDALCAHCKQYDLECTFFLPITETRFKKKKLVGTSLFPRSIAHEALNLADEQKRMDRGVNLAVEREVPGQRLLLDNRMSLLVWKVSRPLIESCSSWQVLLLCHSYSIPPFLLVRPKRTIFETTINGKFQKMETV